LFNGISGVGQFIYQAVLNVFNNYILGHIVKSLTFVFQ